MPSPQQQQPARPSRGARASAARARQTQLIAAACRRLETDERTPDLATLARAAGLSRFHFQRLFKQITGLSPKAYASAHRAWRVQTELAEGASVTTAVFAAGYGSNSPFYAAATQNLGMRPAAYRSGGRGSTIRFAVAQCTLGALLVAESDQGVCAILLGDEPGLLVEELQDRFSQADLVGADPGFEQRIAQVVGLIEAPGIGLELPLDLRGTAFQRRVWAALRRIPAGETISYAALASRIGQPRAARAVAAACAANPVAVLVPCHRVVRTDGTLSGYRWGVERKRALLTRERSAAPRNVPAP
jgi:AraC family transcriptional regulator of adaptative response/methylated-DNA-[protein]-cysteine methyltransferase